MMMATRERSGASMSFISSLAHFPYGKHYTSQSYQHYFCTYPSLSSSSSSLIFSPTLIPSHQSHLYFKNKFRSEITAPTAQNTSNDNISSASQSSQSSQSSESSPPAATPSKPDQKVWEREYKSYIRRNGRVICSMSYAGYRRGGRGAIFADYDRARQQSTNDGKDTINDTVLAHGNKEKQVDVEGIPSMYVTRDQILKGSSSANENEMKGLDHILTRVEGYDPEKQFVVVFSWAGLMGADVVTPTVSPRKVWEMDGGDDRKQGKTADFKTN